MTTQIMIRFDGFKISIFIFEVKGFCCTGKYHHFSKKNLLSSISAEATIAEKKESLVKSFLQVENALSFMPPGLCTGQLIS